MRDLSDCNRLQLDLDEFQQWCTLNCLNLNIDKCYAVTFSRKSSSDISFDYKLNGCVIKRSTEIKDLGIIFDSKLAFTKHIDYIVSKSFSMIGFIRRNTQEFRDPATLKSLYISLVRSRLEYCSIIWSPYYEVHSTKIERVQKIFTKFAICKLPWHGYVPPYIGRRKLLGLQSLKERRDYFSIVFIYKLINGYINCDYLTNLLILYNPPRNLRNNRLLVGALHTTNYAKNEPIARCIELCNTYSSVIDFNISIDRFKCNLFTIFN